jgi:protein O-mannosyl-transferase
MSDGKLIRKYAIVFVGMAALIVYYPVLSAPFLNLDDTTLIGSLINSNDIGSVKSILTLFYPNSISRYYRPLLISTYWIDYGIWHQAESGFHLTNYLLHCFNSLLVFAIALKLFNDSSYRKSLACMAGMLFAVHPLTCESVAWISGRTDLLAGFFSLLAFYFFLGRASARWVACLSCLLAALLSKESALALLPIILLSNMALQYQKGRTTVQVVKSTLLCAVLLAIPLFIYLFLRMGGVEHLDSGVQKALSNRVSADNAGLNWQLLCYAAAVVAFYVKKLFVPFPLNLAIYKISERSYELFFVFMMATGGFWWVKKMRSSCLLLSLMVIGFSPAILVATSKMAWMPIAERYVYLSVAVWAISMVRLFQYAVTKRPRLAPVAKTTVLLVMSMFFVGSFHRALQWTDNQRLWADTYRKSPHNGKVLYKYGESLGGAAGVPYFKAAVATAPDDQWKDYSLLALAAHAVSTNRYAEARAYIDRALGINATPENYYRAVGILMRMKDLNPMERDALLRQCIEYYNAAYAKQKDPMALYAMGNLYLELREKAHARFCFKEILDHFPLTAFARHARLRLGGSQNEHVGPMPPQEK